MDARTFESLQLGDILEAVSALCQSPLGRERVREARPASTLEEVTAALRPVEEAIALMDRGHDLALDGLGDPRPLWTAMAPEGHALDPEGLALVAGFLEAVRRAEGFLREMRADAPALARIGEGLAPATALERDLRRAIRPDGLVADEASDDLARVRADIRRSESRLRSLVDRLVEDLSGQGVLQDSYATLRGGRYVFPVRASSKSRVSGILHGGSNTGETVFIEPASVVEAGNAVEEMRAAEAREVHRVCLALTRRARAILPGMRADTERLARLDSIFGRARAAGRFGWKIPQVVDRGPLRLLDAHHPLLHLRARERSIGVRLTLEAADRSIVVSGPNTGGKTTLLKTLGLAAALVQCGIPAPLSPDSRLPVFADIWADIGDAQDVASGQSTFSAHAARLADIVKHARERTLILLDELGTATDPAEGAALAVALLDWLCHRGSLTLATSHLTPLKQWAHETPGARNASFALDERQRRPTFSLLLDVPGSSEALVIAEREGLPAELIERARRRLERGEADLSALLGALGRRERSLATREEELRVRLAALAEQEELARRRAETLREERRRWRETLARRREEQLAAIREEIERRIADLPARDAPPAQLRAELAQARRDIEKAQREAATETRRAAEALPPMLGPEDLKPGREVFIADLRETGTLKAADFDRRRAQVFLARGLLVEVPFDGLAFSPDEMPRPAPAAGTRAGEFLAPIDDFEADSAPGGGPTRKQSKKIKRQKSKAEAAEDETPKTKPASLQWHSGAGTSSKGIGSPSRPVRPIGRISPIGSAAAPPVPPPAASSPDSSPPASALSGAVHFRRRGDLSWQIDLHGLRVEEAIEVVDKYLDDAMLADMPFVKICHGQGTGALARGIREYLRAHPHVRGWRPGQPEEGGGGVTVVDLR